MSARRSDSQAPDPAPTPVSSGDRALGALVLRVSALLRDADTCDANESGPEARRLVAAVLDRSPASIAMGVATGEVVVSTSTVRVLAAAERFATGMPFAYAVGTAAFRHLLLDVDPRVLIPRPETELLVDHVLRLRAGATGGVAADIGTGSGAIALALAQEGRFDRVVATDISADALAVARGNSERLASSLRTAVEFRHGSDLAPLQGLSVSMLVANPPYIAYHEAEALPAMVRDWEPPTALFAPDDGMARYAAILSGAASVLQPNGWVVLECDATRADRTLALAHATGHYTALAVHDDLSGRPRVLVAQRRP